MAVEELITEHKIRTIKFDPVYMYSMAISGDSSPQVVQLAPTAWSAEVSTTPLREKQYSNWKGWLDVQKNGLRKFKMHDVSREYPLHYLPTPPALTRAAGGAFDWTCTLAAVNSSNRFEITLSGLPAGFVLSSGDYLGFNDEPAIASINWSDNSTVNWSDNSLVEWNFSTPVGRRSLHRVSYPGFTANGAGLVTVVVEPRINPGLTGTPTVELHKPYALMQIVPDSIDYGENAPEGRGRVIKFKAKQTPKY